MFPGSVNLIEIWLEPSQKANLEIPTQHFPPRKKAVSRFFNINNILSNKSAKNFTESFSRIIAFMAFTKQNIGIIKIRKISMECHVCSRSDNTHPRIHASFCQIKWWVCWFDRRSFTADFDGVTREQRFMKEKYRYSSYHSRRTNKQRKQSKIIMFFFSGSPVILIL